MQQYHTTPKRPISQPVHNEFVPEFQIKTMKKSGTETKKFCFKQNDNQLYHPDKISENLEELRNEGYRSDDEIEEFYSQNIVNLHQMAEIGDEQG